MGANLRINDKFVVMADDSLTDFNRKTLSLMYMPLIGSKAISLYYAFEGCIGQNRNESDEFSHRKIMTMVDLESIAEFNHQRRKLEGIGLLDVYFKDASETRIYLLKKPLLPGEFLCDPSLGSFLLTQIGEVEFEKLGMDFLIRKQDLRTYRKITAAFDDVFQATQSERKNFLSGLYQTNKATTISVKNPGFDYEYFSITLSTSNMVDPDLIKSDAFKNNVLRLSFVFSLTEDDMKDAVIQSINLEKEFSYDEFGKNVRYVYLKKHKSTSPKLVTVEQEEEEGSKKSDIVRTLEAQTPQEILEAMTKMTVSPLDLQIFDELLKTTNLPIGVINTMIVYTLIEKDGDLPNFNYFLKMANHWARSKINTTEKAVEYINRPKQAYRQKGFSTNVIEKPVPDWYPEYLEESKQKRASKKNPAKESFDLDALVKELNELPKGGKS